MMNRVLVFVCLVATAFAAGSVEWVADTPKDAVAAPMEDTPKSAVPDASVIVPDAEPEKAAVVLDANAPSANTATLSTEAVKASGQLLSTPAPSTPSTPSTPSASSSNNMVTVSTNGKSLIAPVMLKHEEFHNFISGVDADTVDEANQKQPQFFYFNAPNHYPVKDDKKDDDDGAKYSYPESPLTHSGKFDDYLKYGNYPGVDNYMNYYVHDLAQGRYNGPLGGFDKNHVFPPAPDAAAGDDEEAPSDDDGQQEPSEETKQQVIDHLKSLGKNPDDYVVPNLFYGPNSDKKDAAQDQQGGDRYYHPMYQDQYYAQNALAAADPNQQAYYYYYHYLPALHHYNNYMVGQQYPYPPQLDGSDDDGSDDGQVLDARSKIYHLLTQLEHSKHMGYPQEHVDGLKQHIGILVAHIRNLVTADDGSSSDDSQDDAAAPTTSDDDKYIIPQEMQEEETQDEDEHKRVPADIRMREKKAQASGSHKKNSKANHEKAKIIKKFRSSLKNKK